MSFAVELLEDARFPPSTPVLSALRFNSRTMTDKLSKKKYDPVAKKHVDFKEAKIK